MTEPFVFPGRELKTVPLPQFITGDNATDDLLRGLLERAYVEHGNGEDGTLVADFKPIYIAISISPDHGGMIRLKTSIISPQPITLDKLLEAANQCNTIVPLPRAVIDLEHGSLDLTYHLLLKSGITPKTFILTIHEFRLAAEQYYSIQIPHLRRLANEAAAAAARGHDRALTEVGEGELT